jgi:hypothetical protein
MAYDLTRTRLYNYDVTWDSYAFGAVDEVAPDFEIKVKEIKIGSFGDVKVGERIIGLEGKIKVMAREIDITLLRKMLPWYTSGSVPLLPATVHKDLYDYAKLLTIHPIDISGTTEDLTFLKAVPRFKPMQRDGTKDDVVEVNFEIFPDRTQLPTLVYGYVGASP